MPVTAQTNSVISSRRVSILVFLSLFGLGCINSQTEKKDEPVEQKQLSQSKREKSNKSCWDFIRLNDPGISELEFTDWYLDCQNSNKAKKKVDANTLIKIQSMKFFDCSPYILDDGLKQAIAGAPKLIYLRLGNNSESRDLIWASSLKNLHGLCLRGADLSDDGLHSLARMDNLRWLNLRKANLKLQRENPLPCLPQLEVLLLNRANDIQIPNVGQFPKLKSLTISESYVTASGIKKLVKANPSLCYLDLTHTRSISRNSIKFLRQFESLEFLAVGGTSLDPTVKEPHLVDGYYPLQELSLQLPEAFIEVAR